MEKRPGVGGELGERVHGRRERPAVEHPVTVEDLQRILLLRKEQAAWGSGDVDPKEVVERAEVSHRELAMECLDDGVEDGDSAGGEDDVIHVQQEVGEFPATTENKHRRVRPRGDEADGVQVRGEAREPCPRRLLEAVEGTVQPTDVRG